MNAFPRIITGLIEGALELIVVIVEAVPDIIVALVAALPDLFSCNYYKATKDL